MNYKIAVDGTAGSGKSTICKLIAKNYGFTFISTGGFYRSYGYVLKNANLLDKLEDKEKILSECKKYEVKVIEDSFFINNKNVTSLLKEESVSLAASLIATKQYIRNFIKQKIMDLTNAYPKVLMDGRGIVEEFMPDANLKFYFFSSLKVRTQRRKKELESLNKKSSFFSIYFDLFKRDWKDKHRKLAPSKISFDTIKINTSHKSIDDVFSEVKKYIKV